MINFIDIIFLLQFFIVLGLIFVKIYNILNFQKDKKYNDKQSTPINIKISFLMVIAFFLFYGVGFVSTLISIDEMIFVQLFRLETFFVIPYILFFIIELFMFIRDTAVSPVKATGTKAAGLK